MSFDRLISELGVIAAAIVGLAIIAVLVSRNAQTPAVIKSAGNSFAEAIRAATGPVSGTGFGSFNSMSSF